MSRKNNDGPRRHQRVARRCKDCGRKVSEPHAYECPHAQSRKGKRQSMSNYSAPDYEAEVMRRLGVTP